MFAVSRRGQRKTSAIRAGLLSLSTILAPLDPLCHHPRPSCAGHQTTIILSQNPGADQSPPLSSQEAHSAGEYVQHIQQALDIFYEEVGKRSSRFPDLLPHRESPPGASRAAVFSEIHAEQRAPLGADIWRGRDGRVAGTKLLCEGKF